MIYPISPAELREDFLSSHIYPDTEQTFYCNPAFEHFAVTWR